MAARVSTSSVHTPEEASRLASLAYERYMEEVALSNKMSRLSILPYSNDKNQVYLICLYMLTDNPIDGIHGGIYPISVHSTQDETTKRAKEYMEQYELESIRILKMREWNPLLDKEATVKHNMVNHVEQMEKDECQKQVDSHRRFIRKSKQLEDDLKKRRTVGTPEYYAVKTVQVCRRTIEIAKLNRKLRDLEKDQQSDIDSLRETHQIHPEYEEKIGVFEEEAWIGTAKRIMFPHDGRDELNQVTLIHKTLKQQWLSTSK
jgi:hypothetical protein